MARSPPAAGCPIHAIRAARHRLAPFVTVGVVVGLAMLPAVPPEAIAQTDRPAAASPRVLVKVEAGEALEVPSEPLGDDWVVIDVPAGTTAEALVADLGTEPGVVDVEVEHPYEALGDPIEVPIGAGVGAVAATSSNDPLLPYQWHLGQVGAPAAWSTTLGGGVTVAVLDTGVARGSDLGCGGYVADYDARTGTSGTGVADDPDGHGTHDAGTIGQCTNNGIGGAGVAPLARLMPVKVLPGGTSDVVRGLTWARQKGARVVNLSLGRRCLPDEGTSWPGCSDQALNEAIEAAVAAGVVIVAAVGNDNAAHVVFPANHPKVIAVGATDARRQRAPYSNRGTALDLVAPGGDLNRADAGTGYPDGVLQQSRFEGVWGYYLLQGTSMAAPHASGAVALLLAARPDLTPVQVRGALTSTARDLGVAGKDSIYGYGELRIVEALAAVTAIGWNPPPSWPARARLAFDVSSDGLRLSWPVAASKAGISGYDLYRDGKKVATTTSRSTTVRGLTNGRQYRFQIRARDTSGTTSSALSLTVTPVSGFRDTAGSIFATDIRWLATGEITKGCNPPSNDRFCPSDAVTRGQMAAFMVRALRLTATSGMRFRDVPRGSTFAADIDRLATAGITKGCNPPTNDRFCPSEAVTRGQMAAFMVRALRLTATSGVRFQDVARGSTFARDVDRLATAGITMGCNPPRNDRFCPADPVTRGQMAAFLRRAMAA